MDQYEKFAEGLGKGIDALAFLHGIKRKDGESDEQLEARIELSKNWRNKSDE